MKIGSRVRLASNVKAGDVIAGYDIQPEMMFNGYRTVRETYKFREQEYSAKLFNKGMFWYYPSGALIEKKS